MNSFIKNSNTCNYLTQFIEDFYIDVLLQCSTEIKHLVDFINIGVICEFNANSHILYLSLENILIDILVNSLNTCCVQFFLLNCFFVKLIYFKITSVTFWLLLPTFLFFSGLISFLLIKTKLFNNTVWVFTVAILKLAVIYQIILLYMYFFFQKKGIFLSVGSPYLYNLSCNISIIKLILLLLIYLVILITMNFLKIYYKKTLTLIKPELCSISLFLAFGSSMVFLQNDLFSIFLYLEVVSFCIYGFIFLQPRTNSQLHGLIRYVLFSLWIATFYILGTSLYLSLDNLSTTLFLNLNSSTNLINNNTALGSLSFNFEDLYILLSIFFVIIYFFFKLGAGPFYTWVVDVYNSCTTGSLLSVSIVPKLVFMPTIFFLLFFNFFNFYLFWEILLFSIGLLTSMVGAFGVLSTSKLKEIYAWSSILHTGNILCLSACFTKEVFVLIVFYLIGYTLISFGFITLIISMVNKKTGRFPKIVDELSSLNFLKTTFFFGAITLFASSAGFTPLLSFFMKFSVLSSISYTYGSFFVVFLGLINIVGSYAYLKIIWSLVFIKIDFYKIWKVRNSKNKFIFYLDYFTGVLINIVLLIIIFGYFFFLWICSTVNNWFSMFLFG